MPELPEAETIARGLADQLVERTVHSVELNRQDVLHGSPVVPCAVLRSRTITSVNRVGKQVRLRLSGGVCLSFHLGMSGRLIICKPTEPIAPHTHLRLGFEGNGTELRFCDPRRFGGVWIMQERNPGPVEAGPLNRTWIGRRLPPAGLDPLTATLDELVVALGRSRRLKPLLLDQSIIAGLGNIYCDEILHRAGVHPLTRANRLDRKQVGHLRRTIRHVLTEAIAAGGSSISDYRTSDNTPGAYQTRHRVYGREGKSCRRCRTTIQRFVLGGRSTFVCPQCQLP